MPKITLTEKQKSQELLCRFIDARLGYTGIKTYSKLAQLLIMRTNTLREKMYGRSEFKQSELSSLFRILHFSDQEILDVLKRR